jgi:hypothetical protein
MGECLTLRPPYPGIDEMTESKLSLKGRRLKAIFEAKFPLQTSLRLGMNQNMYLIGLHDRLNMVDVFWE